MNILTDAITQWATRQNTYRLLHDYYRGNHQLRFASRDYLAKQTQKLLTDTVMSLRENLCPAAVTAFTDGIAIQQWTTTDDGHDNDGAAKTHGLSRLEGFIDRAGFIYGDAYAIVWPNSDGTPTPVFCDPTTMAAKPDPDDPSQLSWAARIWTDDGYGRVNLYLPDRLERWITKNRIAGDMPTTDDAWTGCIDGYEDIIPHPFGVVPVCWWKRDPDDHMSHGHSILTDVIPLQDALNKTLADLIITTETYARPFYALLNHDVEETMRNPYAPTPTRPTSSQGINFDKQQIWATNGPGPLLRFDPPDLTPLLKVQDAFAAKIARVVGIPYHYLSQTSGDVPSGEALRILSTRRTATIRAWQRDAEPVWNGLLQLLGVEPGIQWAEPMPLDPLEQLQVAQAKQQLGYALTDIVHDLDEPDPEGVVQRASDAAAQSAQAAGRALMNGTIGYDS